MSPSKCHINTASRVPPGENNHQPGEPSTWALVAAQDTLWGGSRDDAFSFLSAVKNSERHVLS